MEAPGGLDFCRMRMQALPVQPRLTLAAGTFAEPEKSRENQAKLTDLMDILKQIEAHQQHLLKKAQSQKQEV